MGYRDDFYTEENIVGYTGDINNNPTVYFEKNHGNGEISYGRITQSHGDPENQGREFILKEKEGKVLRTNERVFYDDIENAQTVHQFEENNKGLKFDINKISTIEDNNGKTWKVGERFVERNGEDTHISRGVLKTEISSADREELAKSANKFKDIKEKQKHLTPKGKIEFNESFEEMFASLPTPPSQTKEQEKLKTEKNDVLDVPTSKGKQKEKRKAALPKNGSDILSSDKFKKKVKNPKVALQDNELAILSSGKSKKDLAKLAVLPKKNPRNNAPIKVSSGQVKKKRVKTKGHSNNL